MKSRVLRVLVCGASGRMGLALQREISSTAGFSCAGLVDARPGAGVAGPGAFSALLEGADVAVDFSSPSAACAFAAACAAARKPFVTGTTGFSKAQLAALKKAGRRAPVFFSPNMSPAVNLTFALAVLAARSLKGFDIHIHELHHKAKKDAPSGTALRCAAIVAAARGGSLPPVTSVRAGDIIGEHSILYAGPHETVELTHRAGSRALFAAGALRAAAWTAARGPGFYDYFDLLDIKDML